MHCARPLHKNYLIQILLYLHFTWRKLRLREFTPWGLKALAHHLFVHCLCQMLFRFLRLRQWQGSIWGVEAVFSGKSHPSWFLEQEEQGWLLRFASAFGILGFSLLSFFVFNICLKKSITDVHIINNEPGSIPSNSGLRTRILQGFRTYWCLSSSWRRVPQERAIPWGLHFIIFLISS